MTHSNEALKMEEPLLKINSEREIYANPAQAYVLNMFCRTMVVLAGRGFGKGWILAYWFLKLIQRMPGCTLAFVSPSVKRAKTNTLPSITAHWERAGYHRNQAWVIGRRPPKSLGFEKPNFEMDDYENVISWYNGSQIIIISQDRPGTSNSLSLDGVAIDEGRYIDYRQLKDETFPANRGNEDRYGRHSCHHAVLAVSDMSTTSSANWMLNYSEKADTEENRRYIQAIEACIQEIWRIRVKIANAAARHEVPKAYLRKELVRRSRQLEQFRSRAILYKEYSSIENIQILGRGFIERMYRDLPKMTFRVSILGKRSGLTGTGFYSSMNESHTYHCPSNFHNLDEAGYDFDKLRKMGCMADGDVDLLCPICIGFDFNANINCLVCGQSNSRYARIIKSFYVKFDRKLPELVDDFCEYFNGMINKEVVFYYDSTALGSNYAVNDQDFHQVISERFEQNGWTVNDVYLGNPLPHAEKHLLINGMFQGVRNLIPLYNTENNEDLLIAMANAGVYNGHKDKRKEKTDETEDSPLQTRTDFTDANDTLLIGMERFPQATISNVYIGTIG